MVDEQKRENAGDKDPVQELAMSRLSRAGIETGEDANGVWVFNPRPLRVHHIHVTKGLRYSSGCRICQKDVGSLFVRLEEAAAGDDLLASLVQGNGAYGIKDSPSPRDSGGDSGKVLDDTDRESDTERVDEGDGW